MDGARGRGFRIREMWLALGIRGGVTPSELAGEVQRTDGCPGAADGLVEGGGFKVDTAVAVLSRR